jgi:hypothetical protein
MATEARRGEQVKRPHAFLTWLGLFVGAIFRTRGVDCSTRWNAMRDKREFDEAEYYDLAGKLIHGQYEFGPRRVIGHPAALVLMRLCLGDPKTGPYVGNLSVLEWVVSDPSGQCSYHRFGDPELFRPGSPPRVSSGTGHLLDVTHICDSCRAD